jgi:hypothetical protein
MHLRVLTRKLLLQLVYSQSLLSYALHLFLFDLDLPQNLFRKAIASVWRIDARHRKSSIHTTVWFKKCVIISFAHNHGLRISIFEQILGYVFNGGNCILVQWLPTPSNDLILREQGKSFPTAYLAIWFCKSQAITFLMVRFRTLFNLTSFLAEKSSVGLSSKV